MSKKSLATTTTSLLLHIHVRPGAKSNAIRQLDSDNQLRIDIAADAQDGKANSELLDYLKRILQLHSNQLELIHGQKQRDKIVRISIFDPEENLFERLRNEIT